jgi:hypothetical protein
VRSLQNKTDDILELQRHLSLDLFLLVESWHDDDSVCIRRLRREGFNVVDQPRPRLRSASTSTNHGGVVIMSSPRVHQHRLTVDFPIRTFEMVCSRITCGTKSFVVILLYRTGPISSCFFDELSQVLDIFATRSDQLLLAGDLNVHLEKRNHPDSVKLLNMLSSYGLSSNVSFATHSLGGTLDVLFSRADLPSLEVTVTDPQLSDHFLLTWKLPVAKPSPTYTTTSYRPWSSLNVPELRHYISNSPLHRSESWDNLEVDQLASLFDETLTSILDRMIPMKTVTLRHRSSDPWYDSYCREAKNSRV